MLEHLDRRVRAYTLRIGGTAFEVGDRAVLFGIRQRAPQLFPRLSTLVVQPGLSIASSTDEQLRLIAGAASYVQSVPKGQRQPRRPSWPPATGSSAQYAAAYRYPRDW